jgi:hypothetical protein
MSEWLRDRFRDAPLTRTPSLTLPAEHEPAPPQCFVGVDQAQVSDWTAVCIAERHGKAGQGSYQLRHLERLDRGTPYPRIVEHVAAIVRSPEIADRSTLVVDATGVGRPVIDMLRAEQFKARLVAVVITAGVDVSHEGIYWHAPKRDLVSAVQVLLQTERLKIAPALPAAELLARELESFEVRLSPAGYDSYSARVGEHDDLVLSVALACWAGERNLGPPEFWCI